MKKSKIAFIAFFFSTFLLFLNYETSISIANPIPVYPSEFGGFIPKDDYSCFMPNASVLIKINATDPYSHFDLDFSGNYSLYNPNETLNLTIAAPFSEHLFGLNSNCTIKINNTILPYEVIEYQRNESYSWDIYIKVYHRNLIVCNITLPKNKTVNLEYAFKTSFTSTLRDVGYLDFHYDIGTSKIWNGTISERIEFKVHGRQPDSFFNVSSPTINFTIIEIADTKRYIWEWENAIIPTGLYSVYISYKGNYNYSMWPLISLGNWYIIFLLLGLVSLLIVSKRRVKQIKLKSL